MVSEAELLNKINLINMRRREMKKEIKGRIHELSWWKHIRRSIGYVYRYSCIQMNDLINKLGIHVKDIEDVLEPLMHCNLVRKYGDKIVITSEGEDCAMRLGFKVRGPEAFTPHLKEKIKGEVESFIKYKLPPPDPYFYQWYFTPKSVLQILEYMINEIDIEGVKVACLMTPTIGLALRLTGYAANNGKEVYVFDADGVVVDQLKKIGVNAIQYDIEEQVPNDYRGRFDCVIIDPPYDEDFYFTSISRAIELLNDPKDKVIYCVIPPPEIAYLTRPGFPPLLTRITQLFGECGLTIEDIAKGICQYLTPPFEMAVLLKRLEIEDKKSVSESWRSSDLIKARFFKRALPLLPFDVELPKKKVNYERFKGRFLEHSQGILSYKDSYTKPEVEGPIEAKKWDEFNEIFLGPISLPYSVLIHDIGTWDDPKNRLIKFKGCVAHYVWQKIKDYTQINSKIIDELTKLIKNEFQEAPPEDLIRTDLKNFIENLQKVGLIK